MLSEPVIRDFLKGEPPAYATHWFSSTSPAIVAMVLEVEHDSAKLGWAHHIEMHSGFEVGLLLSGQDDRMSARSHWLLRSGQVWMHAMWEPHGGLVHAAHTKEVVLIFRPEFLGNEMIGDASWLSLFATEQSERPQLRGDARREALAIGAQMERELTLQPKGLETALRIHLMHLLLLLYRNWKSPSETGNRTWTRISNLPRVVPAIELVQANPGSRITVRQAADVCGFSPTHFKRMFRETMGVSLAAFCLRSRLAHVADRLLATNLPEEAIAHEMGFVDASHLHHHFVSYFGITPGRYRHGARTGGSREGRQRG
ncbi:MAG: helix-turn-helix domain-containing protein [Armatimonadota bacterium]